MPRLDAGLVFYQCRLTLKPLQQQTPIACTRKLHPSLGNFRIWVSSHHLLIMLEIVPRQGRMLRLAREVWGVHFLRRFLHGRHPVRDRLLLSGIFRITGIIEGG